MMPRRPRALFLTPWYPVREDPAWGVFVREHARAAALHADVTVLHTIGGREDGTGTERETDPTLTAGIETIRLRVARSAHGMVASARQLRAILAAIRRLQAAGFRPDILHAHTFDPGFPAAVLGRLLRIPVVISEHYSAFPLGTLTRGEILKSRIAFRWAHRVMPVSRALQDAIEGYGIKARFELVPNAVDTAVFFPSNRAAPPESTRRFLFVGRMHPIKGVATLLGAAGRIRSHARAWHLDLVGGGEGRGEYEALASELGISDRVSFHGILDKPAIAELMRRADVLVLPSEWDNAPCVLIEAMSCGLPVLASRVGGIPEFVRPETGCLLEPGADEEWAAAMAAFLERTARHDSAAITAAARPYSLRSVGARFHEIYSRATGG